MTAVVAISLYAVIVAGLLVGNHRMCTRTVRIGGTYPSYVPVRPPVTQAEVDETWASVWPSAVEPADIDTLEQRVYDRLFDELIAIEGLQ